MFVPSEWKYNQNTKTKQFTSLQAKEKLETACALFAKWKIFDKIKLN